MASPQSEISSFRHAVVHMEYMLISAVPDFTVKVMEVLLTLSVPVGFFHFLPCNRSHKVTCTAALILCMFYACVQGAEV